MMNRHCERSEARLIGQPLQRRLGQPVVVDYRPGAAGNVAIAAVVKAQPDGGTLIFVGADNAIDATLYKNLPFGFIRDIAMMAGVSMVHVPYRGGAAALADLVAGRTQFMIGQVSEAIGFIRAGRLRALAVTSSKPWPAVKFSGAKVD